MLSHALTRMFPQLSMRIQVSQQPSTRGISGRRRDRGPNRAGMAASLLAMLIFALPAPMKSQDSARKLSEQPTTGIQSLANRLAVQIAKSGRAKVLVVGIK